MVIRIGVPAPSRNWLRAQFSVGGLRVPFHEVSGHQFRVRDPLRIATGQPHAFQITDSTFPRGILAKGQQFGSVTHWDESDWWGMAGLGLL